MKIEDDPLLPQCFKDNPSPDRKAMEWVTEQIRKLQRGQWQRAKDTYDRWHDAPCDLPPHQQDNERRRRANEWLRKLVVRLTSGDSVAPGLKNKPK